MIVHFHKSDSRFCGSADSPRRFTVEPNAVTCPQCAGNDRLTLSPRGVQTLAECGYDSHGRRMKPQAWIVFGFVDRDRQPVMVVSAPTWPVAEGHARTRIAQALGVSRAHVGVSASPLPVHVWLRTVAKRGHGVI